MIRVNTKKLLLRYCDLIDLVVEFAWRIAAALLGLLMSALAVQIFRRTLFKAPIFGIEEGVTAAMVWFAALGAVVVTRQNGHAQVEFFLRFLPGQVKKAVNALAYLLGGMVSVLMVEGGLRLYRVQAKAVPQGGLPFGRVYYYALPMIVMGILLVLVCLSQILRIYVQDEMAREGGDMI